MLPVEDPPPAQPAWQKFDVVLFLRNDGDNKPIEETLYLWRERRAL
jgi:hypothetical protein